MQLPSQSPTGRSTFCYSKALWPQLIIDVCQISRTFCQTDFPDTDALEFGSEYFQETLGSSLAKNVPLTQGEKPHQPWWAKNVDGARHKAHRFHRIWRFRRDQTSSLSYHKFQAMFRRKIRFAKRDYHRKTLQSFSAITTGALFDEQCRPTLLGTNNDLAD